VFLFNNAHPTANRCYSWGPKHADLRVTVIWRRELSAGRAKGRAEGKQMGKSRCQYIARARAHTHTHTHTHTHDTFAILLSSNCNNIANMCAYGLIIVEIHIIHGLKLQRP
jgi:hypothetical protein